MLSNGCKSLTSPSSGNRPARETRVSVVTRNLKEVSGKHLTQRTAQRVKESITRCIEGELYLKVNKEKTVVSYVKGVKYLGYSFYISKGKNAQGSFLAETA